MIHHRIQHRLLQVALHNHCKKAGNLAMLTSHQNPAPPLFPSSFFFFKRHRLLQVALHINYFNKPDLQRQVVRIILMVPVYALVSWASLRYVSARRWLAPLCEVYEAVVLYSFHCYLTTYLRYKTGDYPAWCAQLPPQAPLPPLNGKLGQLLGMRTITDGEDFMARMRTVRALANSAPVLWLMFGVDVSAEARCYSPLLTVIHRCCLTWNVGMTLFF